MLKGADKTVYTMAQKDELPAFKERRSALIAAAVTGQLDLTASQLEAGAA